MASWACCCHVVKPQSAGFRGVMGRWCCGFGYGEDEVAPLSGEVDNGSVVLFAFGSFALVGGAYVWVVLGGGEHYEEHGV